MSQSESATPIPPPPQYQHQQHQQHQQQQQQQPPQPQPPQQPQPQPQQQQQYSPSVQCTPRLTFWIVAGASWAVWTFAVAAAADDKWIDDNGQGEWVAVAEDGLLSFCNELQDWEAEDYDTICSVYKAFTAMQIIGTIACSVSVVLLALACFLPAAGGCASVRTFALMGGALMATYALFQLLAVVLAGVMKQKLNGVSDDSDDGFTGYGYGYGYYDFSDGGYEADMGPTFGVGVSGLIFAVIVATLLLLCARRAGAGPLHECCRSLMIANKNNPSIFGSGGIGGGGGAADGTQRAAASAAPLPVPQATGTDTTSAAAAHHHQEAVPPPLEAVPLSEPQTTSSGGAPPPPQAAARTAAAAAALTGEQQIPFPRYDVLPPAPE